jgi:hypothetical protein
MQYNLATLAKRQRNIRRSEITLPVIVAPAIYASDLFTSCYRPIVDLWASSVDEIVQEYARSLSDMVTDSPEDVQAIIDEVERSAVALSLSLTPQVQGWALKVEQYIRTRWAGAVLSATGVRLDTMLGPEDVRATLQTYIGWNVDLIKDVSAQARQRIANAVFSGFQNRTPAREVAKQIREAVAMSRRRSTLIASDQLSKLSSALADERGREAGLICWKWVHSGKRHPRKHHLERNGFLYSSVKAEQGKHVKGVIVRVPPEQDDWPSRPPWCGCSQQFLLVLEFDEDK